MERSVLNKLIDCVICGEPIMIIDKNDVNCKFWIIPEVIDISSGLSVIVRCEKGSWDVNQEWDFCFREDVPPMND